MSPTAVLTSPMPLRCSLEATAISFISSFTRCTEAMIEAMVLLALSACWVPAST